MHRCTRSVIIALVLGILSTGMLNAQETPPPGESVLAISTLPRLDPPPTTQDFIDAFELGHDAGVNGDLLAKTWSEMEPAQGEFALDPLSEYLAYINATYDYTIFLGIQLLNTTAKETPPDLLDVPFDDPQMGERFRALFDAILPFLNENVRYLSLGNEVDVYLNAHPEEWATYKTFYDQAAAYVHEAAPWMQVGVTVTYNGAVSHAAEVARLTENSDVFILTYYPLDDTIAVGDPAAPLDDFPRMVELAGDVPLLLQEVGYPSAELLGSSEQKQADFVHHVFTAWEAAGEAVPFLNFFLLHDFSEEMCSNFETYYGFSNERFHAMLCSLGLRGSDGTPRPAWETFVDEAGQWAGLETP